MASQTSPIVSIGTIDLSKEIDRENKRKESVHYSRPTDFSDEFAKTAPREELASAGEPEAVTTSGKKSVAPHESLKESKAKLTETVREAIDLLGEEQPGTEALESKLSEIAEEVGDSLHAKILGTPFKDDLKRARFEQLTSRFEGARADFFEAREAAFKELVPAAEDLADISKTDSPVPERRPVEVAIKTLERFGIVPETSGKETPKVLAEAEINLDFLSRRHASQGKKISFFEGEISKIREMLEYLPTREARETAEAKLKELEAALRPLLTEHSLLNTAIREGRFAKESVERQVAVQELGEISKEERSATLAIRSVARGGEEEETGQKIIRTQSATEGFRDSPSEYIAPNASTVALNAANDFSGTTLAIASVGGNIRSEAKKTDQLLKKLLAAALSGNWEAVKSALIFLSKRANMIMTQMGVQTIKAMQFYEKSMAGISKEMGKLKGGEADYGSRLAKFNSEMNLYSMNRQAISNTLRDLMTMTEEITSLTGSVLQGNARIVQAALR